MATARREIIQSQQLLNQNGVLAVTLFDDDLFVTHWFTKHVSVYDSTKLKEKRTIPIDGIGGRWPLGLAVCRPTVNKLLFVSDWRNYCVHKVDLSSDDVITSWNVDVQPIGLSMSTKHNVIVTSDEKIKPLGLAVCRPTVNKLLFVSDYLNKRVHVVDLSSYDVITRWEVAVRPVGLSMSTKHNVIVTSYEEIGEYSTTGKFIRKVRCDKYNMWHAVETSNETQNETLIVSSIQGIVELSWEGKVLRCYGNQQAGSGQGQMDWPMGLALDSKGNVLVCDEYNNRIQVLNSSLPTARSLQLPVNVNQPCAVCFDESRGRLYVGEGCTEGRLLMFDDVINLDAMFE